MEYVVHKVKKGWLYLVLAFFPVSILSGQNPESWDLNALHTAKSVAWLSELEKEVVLEMNKVRTQPRQYAEMYLKPRLQNYNGKYYEVPGEITIVTKEGKKAVQECIRYLSKASPAGMLLPSRGLSKASADHMKDQSKTGKTGHVGGDRSTMQQRIERHGKWEVTIAENIDYGNNRAREIVISLLVDDGVKDRGHRHNIMNGSFKTVGVSCGTHPKYRYMCVMNYAGGFKDP